ncbi:MAG: TrmB family transcriptional regulator [Calditrichaeota bacterium]|nr:MAG: TrmB family transcriptional regulator [Calditrichota bacterium]
MVYDDIAQRMKKLGFTMYEAKAYISLLQHNPATRYELSKQSGVPRSAIYDVIRKLENIGAVNGTYTEPQKYMPLPPDQLFDLLERQFKERVDDVRKAMKHFETSVEPGHLWNIVGYENMIHKAREMIERARTSIYLSVWQREADQLKNELKAAIDRGVTIIAFSFTSIDLPTECKYSYGLDQKELEGFWDHKIILVVDQNELLMGEADARMSKKTTWTHNRAIVDIATNHIILDITLFGMRNNIDVSKTVSAMQAATSDHLQELLARSTRETIQVQNGGGGEA